MYNKLKSLSLGGFLGTRKVVLIVIKYNLGSKRVFKIKMYLVFLRISFRKEVVLSVANLHVLLVVRNIFVGVFWV